MRMIADLHIHSYLSRACSKQLRPETLYRWCQLKGIQVLATGDFTHPLWFARTGGKLSPAEPGLTNRDDLAREQDKLCAQNPAAVPYDLCFGVEISSIYKKNGRVRKVHNPSLPRTETAGKINARLGKIGNIRSDGRPILDSIPKSCFPFCSKSRPKRISYPLHAWTPFFAVFVFTIRVRFAGRMF